ncbi:DUF3006 domain-containing protein [Clostridium sp. SYSU_GA19001]|uniref:DUF3006 domain-containing protein n=1 Tax=Clostridium caldaquaticum TaxID=2940653 RepID=UPI0020772256|nr:DUF3006 domain-containing protein [Clostridium caldaquaticum]MCM8711410.1 DUF3006 domain-containing protein [Clostridium caldaquaticum]
MFGVIDRFEGQFAIVELYYGKIINIKRELLPEGAKEGDVLSIEDKITISLEETNKRKMKIEEITKDIWE